MTDDDIIANLFRYEGGYVDNPADKGGPTKLGITAATLGAWIHPLQGPATAAEVEDMSADVAAAIYKKRYIADPGYDQISDWGLRMIVTDCAVLYGPKCATMWLQTALGVAADGDLGVINLNALLKSDIEDIERDIIQSRIKRIQAVVSSAPSQMIFYNGWMNRAHSLMQYIGES